MSVHGYPVDMSIFCNLQLGLLELQEETPQADINQDNVSLAGVLQGAVGRAVDTPVFALLLDDNTRFSHDRRWDGACSRDHGGIRYGALRSQRSHSNAYAVLSPLAATLLMAQTQSIIVTCTGFHAFGTRMAAVNEIQH